jgi:hypothetical protein
MYDCGYVYLPNIRYKPYVQHLLSSIIKNVHGIAYKKASVVFVITMKPTLQATT